MPVTYDITELKQLTNIIDEIVKLTRDKASQSAVVLALSGELGAGKTTFVQYLATRLGVAETVTSPTFVIMKQYPTTTCFQWLIHIDAYRLESVDEMKILGFVDLLTQPETMICIEWAERIAELLPEDTIKLQFDLAPDGKRTLIVDSHG